MSPRRPRRARRRTRGARIVLLIAAVIVVALVAGGLTRVAHGSEAYRATSNTTLRAQGAVLAQQSNATAGSVRTMLRDLPSLVRQDLQARLDDAVAQTTAQAQRAAVATANTPSGTPGPALASVFAERAQSVEDLRGALDGLLGMTPVPPAGSAAGSAPSGVAPTAAWSATETVNKITAAGALLTRSDALYRSVRRTLATSAGHARLPRSSWVDDPAQWEVANVTALVDQVATSPTLEASHYVVIRTVRLAPSALPTPPGASSSAAVLSPVTQLGVSTVLANQGASAEPSVRTTYTLADQQTGTTVTRSVTTALALAGSVTLPTVLFAVKPGSAYLLSVQVVPPPGQSLTDGTLYQLALRVAPAS